MKRPLYFLMCAVAVCSVSCSDSVVEVEGSADVLTFVGRTDFSNPQAPRQWCAGAYMTFSFNGEGCEIDITDEVLYGNSYNYLEVVVDDLPTARVRTKGFKNRLVIGMQQRALSDSADTVINVMSVMTDLVKGRHEVMLVRDTETGMGYTQIDGVVGPRLGKWTPKTDLRIEFIGNSITCGMSCYDGEIPYGKGTWYDHHRAYYAYGPVTARNLNAQWSLASVSGIGLIHSCCDHPFIMPNVYKNVNLSAGNIDYDFSFNPDIVCCCLGQNDGVQDSTAFATAYVNFLKDLKKHNPNARLVLLSSPMANETLRNYFRMILPPVAAAAEEAGLGTVPYHIFESSYNAGGGYHPSMEEHHVIAAELTEFLRAVIAMK